MVFFQRARRADGKNFHFFNRLAARSYRDAADLLYDVHTLDHFPEHGVLAREMGRVCQVDEKLRAVGVGAGIGHGERASDRSLRAELIFELVSRAAGAGALRAPALEHEVLNNPVKNETVVKRPLYFLASLRIDKIAPAFGQLDEIFYRCGRLVAEELHIDIPVVGLD